MPTLREMIGQMLMVGVKAEQLSREERSLFKTLAIGGFILFERNVFEPEQIVALCRSLWDVAAPRPPFIAIDQEGGRVHRLPEPFTHFPAAGFLGSVQRPGLAYQIGRAAAVELAMVGINLNFAPVLDVNSNPQNPIIGDRSFGQEPELVIRLSQEIIAGLRAAGVIPCGKHFPGHGDTDRDSHVELPLVDRSRAELCARELPPFVYACRAGIESLMTAHVRYRALDPELPATLSRPVVTGLLRRELGYDGVIFTDDLEMKALQDNYGAEQAAALCVRAGVDVLLYGHALDQAARAFEFLSAQAARQRAFRSRVEQSYGRITKLKRRCLKSFSAVMDRPLAPRIAGLGHRRLLAAGHGNL